MNAQTKAPLILPSHLERKVAMARNQKHSKLSNIRTILSCLDLTSLTNQESEKDIEILCRKAILFNLAAVCIPPRHVAFASGLLRGADVKVATVINFPFGNLQTFSDKIATPETTKEDIAEAIKDGARQVDIVYPYTESSCFAQKMIFAAHEVVGDKAQLKAILETAAHTDVESIQEAADISIVNGVGCLKTSTGKHELGGATLEAVAVMLDAIKTSRKHVGIKVTGGLKEIEDCLPYLSLAEIFFSAGRINPSIFRLGASGLFDKILADFSDAVCPSSMVMVPKNPETVFVHIS